MRLLHTFLNGNKNVYEFWEKPINNLKLVYIRYKIVTRLLKNLERFVIRMSQIFGNRDKNV